jgi:hypothetical protein
MSESIPKYPEPVKCPPIFQRQIVKWLAVLEIEDCAISRLSIVRQPI